jgi:hypothetical protein
VPFVEKLIPMLWSQSTLVAALTGICLLSFPLFLMRERELAQRDAAILALMFVAFTAVSFFADYPTPLAGYGASAILGFMLGLAASARRAANEARLKT